MEEAANITAVVCMPTPKDKRMYKKLGCSYEGCGHTRRYPNEMQDHVDFVHLQKFNNVCNHVDEDGKKCEYKCERHGSLPQHKNNKHAGDNRIYKHKCEYEGCGHTRQTPNQLQDHVNFVHLHVYNYVCGHLDEDGNKCEYKCEWPSNLSQHKTSKHSDKRDFKCQVCSEEFKQKKTRDQHYIDKCSPPDHPGRTKYQCSDCIYAYSTQALLNTHCISKHIPKDDPLRTKYKCQECFKGFAHSGNRDDHFIRKHLPRDDPRSIAFYERVNARFAWRYNNDEKFKLITNLRSRLGQLFKKNGLTKHAGTSLLLGCTAEEAILHLNNNDEGYVFGDDVTFGILHIDHIRPMTSIIDPRCKVQVQEVCHFLNIQLLTEADNNAKWANWSPEEYARTPWGMAIAELAVGWRASGICKCALCV
jgi:hypothetical protein